MIEKFSYCTDNNISLELTMGADVDLFIEDNEAKILSFYESDKKGIKWSYNKKWIQLLEQVDNISGYPNVEKDKLVAVYPITSEKCPPPFNALVYNADGTVHMQLEAPEPVTKLPKERAKRMRKTKHVAPEDRLFFYGIKWAEVSGKLVTIAKIGFDRDCWEERIINLETGEFGKCIKTNVK